MFHFAAVTLAALQGFLLLIVIRSGHLVRSLNAVAQSGGARGYLLALMWFLWLGTAETALICYLLRRSLREVVILLAVSTCALASAALLPDYLRLNQRGRDS